MDPEPSDANAAEPQELTRGQKRWQDPAYRAWKAIHEKERRRTDPVYREKLCNKAKQYRLRVKQRELGDGPCQ